MKLFSLALCGCLCAGVVQPAHAQSMNTDLEEMQLQLDINADWRMQVILDHIDALRHVSHVHRTRVLEDESTFTSGGGYGLEGR